MRVSASSVISNAAARLPFEGISELYRALHVERNPIFYVSSSPWNLYALLDDFMRINAIPHGPVFLQDWGVDEATLILQSHTDHKLAQVQTIVDYSGLEPDGVFLEGTGAMVLDHVSRVAYTARSHRADVAVLERFCTDFTYEPMAFDAVDSDGVPVYHTNVIACIGTDVAMIALEMIPDESARAVCESQALNAAQSWVMNRHEVKSINDLVEMIQNAMPNPAVG